MEFLAAIGGLWVALYVLAVLTLGVISAENDSFFVGTLTLVVGLAVAQFIFAVPVWATVIANPLMVVVFVAAYVVAGAAYTALWRWPDWINKKAPNIKSDYESWKGTQKGVDDTFNDFMDSYAYREFTAKENKERLSVWVMMWPWSLFWVLANRPARWIWNQSYRVLGQLFDNVGRRAARRSVENLKK